jgi:hypothetical protein
MTSLPDLPDEGPQGQSRRDDDPSPLSQHTWPQQRASTNRGRAEKAARVHTLTDPLGAKGFRATGGRVRSETGARRKVLLASVATFAASFGLIVATNHSPTDANQSVATQPAATVSSGQQTDTGNVSSVGAAVDLFTNQTTIGLTGLATVAPSATSAAKQRDDEEGDEHDDHEGESDVNASLTTQSTVAASNQVVTSGQSSQSSVSQQPSHTRSGGS